MEVWKYGSILLLITLLSACAESGGGGDYSDFVYNGPEGGTCLDAYDGPLDDYSKESEGICIISGKEYRYRYKVIDRYLKENREARKLTGLDGNVSNCYDAGLVVAAKNYLLSREEINYPDIGHIPPGQETPPEEEQPESTSDDVAEIDKSEIDPLIWKGDSVSYAASENIVRLKMWTESGQNHNCSGIIINDLWILTAAHCLEHFVGDDDAAVCEECFTVYWTDPDNGNFECLTDTYPNHSYCYELRNGLARIHENYTGSGDTNDDIGLLRIYAGWNDTISEARLYNGTPSTS